MLVSKTIKCCLRQDLFGPSFMDHAIVVFTRADAKFDLRDYTINLRQEAPALSVVQEKNPPEKDTLEEDSTEEEEIGGVFEFLTFDIKQRFIGVDNQCESENQKTRTREAVIELIDVVQTANKGNHFSHAYFDKAQQKLVKKKKEEEQASLKFLKEEKEQWDNTLDKAKEISDGISDSHWKSVQRAQLTEEKRNGYQKLIAATLISLKDLKRGFSVVKHILQKSSCVSLWNLTECARRRLDELSRYTLNTTPYPATPMGGYPVYSVDPNTEVIAQIEKNISESATSLKPETTRDQNNLTQKIQEDQFSKECKLALKYVTEVAQIAANDYFQEMNLKRMETDSSQHFHEAKKRIKDDLINHIVLVEVALNNHETEEEQVAKQRVGPLIEDALNQLKKDASGLKNFLTGRKREDHQDTKYHTTVWKTPGKKSEHYSRIQAVDFLIRRQLNIFRLKAIEEECRKDHYHQIILQGKSQKDIQTYNNCFAEIPKLPIMEGPSDLAESFKSQFAEVYVSQLLLQLEEDPDQNQRRKREVDEVLSAVRKEKERCMEKISELTDVLTNVVCRLAPEYAKKCNKDQLEEIKKNNYKKAAEELSPKVIEELSKTEENKRLNNETITYFRSGDKINKAIRIYAKLNHKILADMAKESGEVCFPADAVVVEERNRQMKICDVKVGHRLQTMTKNGTLTYENVFMLGKWQIYEKAVDHSRLFE